VLFLLHHFSAHANRARTKVSFPVSADSPPTYAAALRVSIITRPVVE